MIFGKREKNIEIGSFSSEQCKECKDSYTYKLLMITRYFVVFFINLIPLGTRYEYVCDGCGFKETAETNAGREALKEEFKRKKFRAELFNFLKLLAFAAVIAAAVILPLTLIKNYGADPEFYKNLVSADGQYCISDKSGDILATVSVSGDVKTLTFLDKVSQLVDEPGADGTFYIHQYYQEATDSKGKSIIVRSNSDPGVLMDRYNIPVRDYFYDSSNDTLGYAFGVNDLSKIQYSSGKAVYPFTYYESDNSKENYVTVLFIEDGKRLNATFISSETGGAADEFASLEVQEYTGGKVTKDTLYYFGDDTLSLAKSSGLSQNSSSDDLLNFIQKNNVDPYRITEYGYYKDTKVLSSQALSMADENGAMQKVTQNYDVTEKDGYYIQKAAANSSGS